MNDKNRISFSYKGTRLRLIASVLAVIMAASLLIIFGLQPNNPSRSPYGGLEYPATLESMANGCGNIFYNPPIEGNYSVIPDEFWEYHEEKGTETVKIPTHSMIIPIFGYLANEGFTEDAVRFYSMQEATEAPNLPMLLRTMYDRDITVVWYTTDIAPSDLALIKAFADEHPGEVFAHPWYYSGGSLIGTRSVAYAKWGISQSCGLYNENNLEDFIKFAKEHPIERKKDIPIGKMTDNGELYPIGSNLDD